MNQTKKNKQPLKLVARLIIGIGSLLVVCFSTYIFTINNIVNNMVYTNASASDIILAVIGSAAIILGVFLVVIAIYTAVLIKNTIKSAVTSFEEKSLALASGKTIKSDNTTLDNSFGLDQMSITFNHNLDTISRLISDISTMHELHSQGSYKETIDSGSYEGGYKTIATGINEMVKGHTSSKKEILDCISDIVNGDFGAAIRKYPGDESYINDSIEGLRGNIRNITESITNVAINAQKGNVDFYMDPNMYKGEWVGIIQKLNGILTSIGDPLKETTSILSALKQGDFNKRVQGDFSGEFLAIKNAINTTSDVISSYIEEINTVLIGLADGDLRNKIDRPYVGQFASIKDSINNITVSLYNTMSEIADTSDQVLYSAKQMSTRASDLANGAQDQAASLEELNTAIELINLQTKQTSESASEATELSNESANNAQRGNESMVQMAEAMMQIKDSSSNISYIIKTIQDIAFQTNLLALNASVESARAGEHGVGFSVVADEVRTLAGRSEEAATETTKLIQNSIERVESGSDIAETTSQSLVAIVESASAVLDIISSIYAASKEQAEAIGQASDVLTQISQVVQNNSSVSIETASASEKLNSQAKSLQHLVSYFKLK